MAAGKGSSLDAMVQQVSIHVTQGAADAFANNAFETGISTGAKFGWMLERVEFSIVESLSISQVDNPNYIVQLAQGDEPTALLTPDDDDLICSWRTKLDGIAASTTCVQLPIQYTWQAPPNFVVVNPQIHLCTDSTSITAAYTAYARIYYFPVELTELDILRILAQR